MHRRKIILMAAAVFTIGVALAAPTSDRATRSTHQVQEAAPWVPGTDMLMSAHESSMRPLAPPR